MQFIQSFQFQEIESPVSYTGKLAAIGSCFASSMGLKLEEANYQILTNPAGIVFNPISIAQQLKYSLDPDSFVTGNYIFEHNGLWHSSLHHGKYSHPKKQELLNQILEDFWQFHSQLKSASHLIITWGSAWVYEWKDRAGVVSNCHKMPAATYNKRLLTIDEILAAYNTIIPALKLFNPNMNFIWSISPVKYVRDGLHENNLSKSVLHLALHNLIQMENIHYYFPAFEILQDELRDYRFYAEDLAHPSNIAIEYIWNGFRQHCLSKNEAGITDQLLTLQQAMKHRPLHENTDAYRLFRKTMLEKATQVQKEFPFLNLKKEIDFFS